MGYEMPKVGNAGAFAMPSTFQASQDYENMTGEDYFENEGELQKQIAHYQKIADDYLRKANESGGDAEYWQNNEMYNMNKEVIDNLTQQLVDLKERYIDQNINKEYIATSDYIDVNFSGDQKIIDAIRETDQYETVVKALNQLAGPIGEAELDVIAQEGTTETVSKDEAYKLYKELCDKKDSENKTIITIYSTLLGALTLGANVYVGAGVLAGTAAMNLGIETSPENIDFQELLGGEYTVSNFVLDGDFDLHDKGNRFVYSGIVVHGEPIILENGEVVDNPLNMIIINEDIIR
jgi:hypothetical protein